MPKPSGHTGRHFVQYLPNPCLQFGNLSYIAFRYKMAPIAIRKIAYDLERLNAKALLENSKQPLPIKIPKIKQCDQIM